MLISVEAYSDRTILDSWPSQALLPELMVRASVLDEDDPRVEEEKKEQMNDMKQFGRDILKSV